MIRLIGIIFLALVVVPVAAGLLLVLIGKIADDRARGRD